MKYAVLNLPSPGALSTYSSNFSASRFHPVYAWLGLRPVLAQHTLDEHSALEKWATGRLNAVEIGVAEGVSALALRRNMAADGLLSLIDPFHLSRVPALNFTKRTAHRLVGTCNRGRVRWIEEFSSKAIHAWDRPIDLLLIDGDHSEVGVRRDWDDWNRFVVPRGVVIFHDARIFEGGWTSLEYGPVKLVDDLFRTLRITGWEIVDEIHSLVVVEKIA